MKLIYRANDPTQAHLLQEILESRGIASVIQDEQMFYLRGEMPLVYPSLWVAEENVEDARRICAEFEKGSHQPNVTALWTCPTCGKAIGAAFTECWNCALISNPPANDSGATLQNDSRRKVKYLLGIATLFIIGWAIMNWRPTYNLLFRSRAAGSAGARR